ncbi:hypothetical protein PG996_015138 [Apiospora saccharicola]|uniref:Non-homologous end-joining factor 1 n=1 Tax=Apiospora saccharicola TaxID=335842 RepID=A0ABR1TMZ2_9PEZI
MTAMTLKWVPLPAFENGIPALIVSPNFGTSTYKLHVSDLANVWTESLDRKAIFARSIQEDTSIDLTEGPDQMTILLSYLQAAFDTSSPQHHQTKLTLEAAPKGGLVLLITCTLPGGLKPLRWPVNLARQPPASLASELVLPLIQSQHARALEIENLINTLQQKDAIITKLVDKLEAMGMGLEDVFNALSGKRKVSRVAADAKVNGLAPFDGPEWRQAMFQRISAPVDAASLVQDVLGGPNAVGLKESVIRASDDLNNWWEHMGPGPVSTLVQEPADPVNDEEKEETQQKAGTPTDDDDDFQVQATPPHLASKRRQQQGTEDDDVTTEGDGSDGSPSNHPTPRKDAKKPPPRRIGTIGNRGPSQQPRSSSGNQSSQSVTAGDNDNTASESDAEPVKPSPKKGPAKKIGLIGRKRGSTPQPAKSPTPTPAQPSRPDDDATESDDGSKKVQSPPPSSPPKPVASQRKRGGLGTIGGKVKSQSAARHTRSPSLEHNDGATTTSATKPKAGRLGMIGKRGQEGQAQQNSSKHAGQELSEDSETEEQVAERRRAELAKELERKAAAAPAKKKRKF